MITKTAIEKLPSLPQVLVKILDAIHSQNADFQSIAEIIRQDTGVATRLISAANSSYYGNGKSCNSIEGALLFLGTDVVKTITITASFKQFSKNFNQQDSQFLKHFWHRSLVSANFAKVIATLTGYQSPDEAYLCGLLADVGQLVLLTDSEQVYLTLLESADTDLKLLEQEQQQFGQNHCQVGADLIESWNMDNFIADAIRYHHEDDVLVQDAHHLVKILNLASSLSFQGDIDDQILLSADILFGFNESLTRELRKRINNDVDNMANSLNIDIDDDQHNSNQQLGERLSVLGEQAQLNASFWKTTNQQSLQQAAQRSLFLTLGISKSVLFLVDQETNLITSQNAYQSQPKENNSDALKLNFQLPQIAGRSLISDAFLLATPQSSHENSTSLSVIDQQVLRYCQSDILLCWPLITQESDVKNKVGVLVFSIKNEQREKLEQRNNLSNNLCSEIAQAITTSQQLFNTIDINEENNNLFQKKIDEAAHEAGNPLSIIRNYLEMLRIKLGSDHSANEDLELIKEEIDRVGNILLRLQDTKQLPINDPTLDINSIIEKTAHIFQRSICTTHNIELKLKLDQDLQSIDGKAEHVKQIITNLIKNATEALENDGTIIISSEASVSFSGKDYAAIYIEDNGPGISSDMKKNLFTPIVSTKKGNHSGLGLSIVKKLIDEMNGSIVCRSKVNSGTQFQILLPK